MKKGMKRSVKMGGKIRKIAILTAILILLGSALPVSAKENGYSYTVRIYAGTKGEFLDGDPEVKVFTVPAGGFIRFEESDIVLPEGSRYYVKGIRRSGEDKLSGVFFRVDEDADYVVAYGVQRAGDLVNYRISYVDADGNELAPSKNGEGYVGDTPIVGHLPIEGYRPQAYNLTRTLRAEGSNDFTFRYTKIPTEGPRGADTVREEVETVTNTDTVVVPRNPETEGSVTTTTVVNNETSTNAAGPDENTASAEGGNAEEGQEAMAEPEDLINLDDEETPLAGIGDRGFGIGAGAGNSTGLPPAVYVGFVSVIVLLAAGLYFIVAKKSKKDAKTGKDE